MDLHGLTPVPAGDGPFVTAPVHTLLIATDTAQAAAPWSGAEPTQIATSGRELAELGTADLQEGPMIDVLVRAATGTAADVQLVPGETESAPQTGAGAVLRHADAPGSGAAGQPAADL